MGETSWRLLDDAESLSEMEPPEFIVARKRDSGRDDCPKRPEASYKDYGCRLSAILRRFR